MTRKTVFWNRTVAIAALAASSLGLIGCLKAPDYPVVPKISPESIVLKSYYGRPRENRKDSVRLTFSFQDGDGDLGLGGSRFGVATDTAAPFARLNADKTLNRYYNNFFADIYLKNRTTGVFEKLPAAALPGGNLNERYPRLTSADTKAAPIKGTISRIYGFIYDSPFQAGDEIRFNITIADRALHESNTITTNSIVIPPL